MNRTILEHPEAKLIALRALHAKLREADEGPSLGGLGGPAATAVGDPLVDRLISAGQRS